MWEIWDLFHRQNCSILKKISGFECMSSKSRSQFICFTSTNLTVLIVKRISFFSNFSILVVVYEEQKSVRKIYYPTINHLSPSKGLRISPSSVFHYPKNWFWHSAHSFASNCMTPFLVRSLLSKSVAGKMSIWKEPKQAALFRGAQNSIPRNFHLQSLFWLILLKYRNNSSPNFASCISSLQCCPFRNKEEREN